MAWQPKSATPAQGWQPGSATPADQTNVPRPDAPQPDYNVDWRNAGLSAIPMLGGMAGGALGGMLGGPTPLGIGFGIGGATLGGSMGEAVRQQLAALLGQPGQGSPWQIASSVLRSGLEQGAYEAGGQALMGGLRMASRGLADRALRQTPVMRREFPDAAQTLVRRRITSAAGASTQRRAASRQVGRLLDAGSQAGFSVSIADDVAAPALAAVEEAAGRTLTKAERARAIAAVRTEVGKLVERRSLGVLKLGKGVDALAPEDAKALKQVAQKLSRTIYRAQATGQAVQSDPALVERVAQGLRRGLEKIPGMARAEGRTRSLIGVERAMRRSESLRSPVLPLLPVRVGPFDVGMPLPPRAMAAGAIGAGHPASQITAENIPRLLAYLYGQAQPPRSQSGLDVGP